MSKIRMIVAHEFRMTAANKAFIILTVLGPFLIIAMTIVPAVISQRAEHTGIEIAATGIPEQIFDQIVSPLRQAGVKLEPVELSPEILDRQLLDGELYGYLVFPDDIEHTRSLELVTREFPDFKVVELLKGVIGQAVTEASLKQAGLDSDTITGLMKAVDIETKQITRRGRRFQQDTFSFIMIGIAFTLMLYMTILLYGQSIGRSVVQEKISKTVEIVLSSVSEKDLLFGKILGQAAASLLQYAVWIGMALVGVRLLGPRLGLSELPQLSVDVLIFLVLFFLLGFSIYASMYAALGAAAEDEQNLAQLSWPLIVVLVFPMVISGALITNPSSTFCLVLSLFPLTAPTVMFIRILVSDPAGWQILLSIALQAATVAALIFLSAKIFRIGILMTGKRFKLAEVLRWLRS